MGILENLFGNTLSYIIKYGSDDQLADEYEKRRQAWLDDPNNNNVKTPEMQRLDREISRRSAEKWKNDPRRNTDSDYRWTDANRWE